MREEVFDTKAPSRSLPKTISLRTDMSASKKRIWFILGAVIIAGVAVCAAVFLDEAPSSDPTKLTAYVNRHESELIALAAQYPNEYREISSLLGIKSVDTRLDDVCYGFSWSYWTPEGTKFLYYADDDMIESDGYTFSDSAFTDGLGANGQGYIKCTKLKQNWYFIESYIPT